MSGISHVLAIDLGGSKLQVAIVDSLGNIIASEKRTLIDSNYSEESIMKEIRIAAENVIAKSQKKLHAVGISIPGPCDSENGIFLANFSTGVKNWEYAKTLSDAFSLPCYGDNDVNACAVAEKRFGNCKDISSFIWITLSFGCGGALFEGRLKPGDVVIAISGSGNSENVLRAAEYAKSLGNTLITLTGFDGGKLRKLADIDLHADVNSMQITEDIHMIFDHLMMAVLYKTLAGKEHMKA